MVVFVVVAVVFVVDDHDFSTLTKKKSLMGVPEIQFLIIYSQFRKMVPNIRSWWLPNVRNECSILVENNPYSILFCDIRYR